MNKHAFKSSMKSVLAISALGMSALTMPQAQADNVSTNYPGLMCQPHDPTTAEYAYGTFTDIYNFAAAGTDLGLNCSIPRNQGDKGLNGVKVVVRDDDAGISDVTSCHTHYETLNTTTGDIDYNFGPDVATYNANGTYNVISVPGPGVVVATSANFNLHCHIGGGASLHNYTASVKK